MFEKWGLWLQKTEIWNKYKGINGNKNSRYSFYDDYVLIKKINPVKSKMIHLPLCLPWFLQNFFEQWILWLWMIYIRNKYKMISNNKTETKCYDYDLIHVDVLINIFFLSIRKYFMCLSFGYYCSVIFWIMYIITSTNRYVKWVINIIN